MKIEKTLICPKKARQMLANSATNRRIKPRVVEKYAYDMQSDRWLDTHEAIAIDSRGQLIDGQHRLHAIILSNTLQNLMVCTGCPPENIQIIDTGSPRSTQDTLRIAGVKIKNLAKIVATTRAMFTGIDGLHGAHSNDLIQRCIEKHGDLIQEVCSLTGKDMNYAAMNGPICKAVIYYGWHKIGDFPRSIGDYMFSSADAPATQLVKWIQRHTRPGRSLSRKDTYRKTVTALRLHINGKTAPKGLRLAETDIALPNFADEFVLESAAR